MFPNALTSLKSFLNKDDGLLPIEHGLAAAAVAVVIIASVASISPDMTRVYNGGVLGGSAANGPAPQSIVAVTEGEAGKAVKASAGLFAHLAVRDENNLSDH
jgi:Flp pilus assembly pilin Flp